MRTLPRTALLLVFLPCLAHGQSTLDFPRSMQPAEFATTGFAVVNPGPAPATVTFTLYTADGTAEKASPQTISARGQLAKLGSELFSGAAQGGWVQATSSTAGLQGFWLGGDFRTLSFMDGAEAATPSQQLVLSFITPNSELHVVNTGSQDVTALVELYGDDGLAVGIPYPIGIPRKGSLKAEIAALFPGTNLSLARQVRVRCGCDNPLAGLVIIRNVLVGPSWAVVNAVSTSASTTEINFPHVVDGSAGGAFWQSVLGITNLSTTAPNDVVISFFSETGGVLRTVQRTIPPGGAVRETARVLFGLPAGFNTGWVKVSATLPITGFVTYADTLSGGVAVVPAQPEPQTNLLFSHIADLSPWWTGISLLNATSQDATVEVFALADTGALIGGAANVPTARFDLPAGAKIAKLLSELIPQTQRRTTDGGFVFVRSNVPLFGIELFFTRDLRILSNVAAGRILPGVTYVAPAPSN